MLVKQDINNFRGFGQGALPGSNFFSSGFKRTDTGTCPSRRITPLGVAVPVEQYWLTQFGTGIYSVGFGGEMYNNLGALVHTVSASNGNGLITDQKGRLLYARSEFLGMSEDLLTFDDSFQDFGVSLTKFRPMELFEDMVLIGNDNKIAALFVSDDSFTTDVFNLPDGFSIRAIKAGKTGILIGANCNGRGTLVLWDGQSNRSIAPWINLKDLILSIAADESGSWLVTTTSGVLWTNGYSQSPYARFPVLPPAVITTANGFYRGTVLLQGTAYLDGRLYVAITPEDIVPKLPMGLMVHDSRTGLWEHVPFPPGNLTEGYIGALLFDTGLRLSCTYGVTAPTESHNLGRLRESNAPKSQFITEELGGGNNPKYAEAFIANIRFSPEIANRYVHPQEHAWTVTAKIYDFTRQLFAYGFTSSVSSVANELVNTGSDAQYQGAQKGDEVTVLSGVNAGEVRHIIDITNSGTDNEKWILDSDLPNLTEDGITLQVMPFKLVESKSITGNQDYFFNVRNRPKGKRFLVKLVLDSEGDDTVIPELIGGSFIYDDNAIT